MEAPENAQRITRRVLAVSQLLATALQPEEWAALAMPPAEHLKALSQTTRLLPVHLEGYHFDAEEVEP